MENIQTIGNSLVTEIEFQKYIAELEDYYEKKLTNFAINVYRERISQCQEMDDKSLQIAVTKCINNHACGEKFFPSAEMLIQYGLENNAEKEMNKTVNYLEQIELLKKSDEIIAMSVWTKDNIAEMLVSHGYTDSNENILATIDEIIGLLGKNDAHHKFILNMAIGRAKNDGAIK